jgi:glycosyltransferase involved in cell wall biosynthesis
MSVYLIVSADFLLTGGQDRANYALASYLARRGDEVHLVAHEVDPQLLREGNVVWRRVPRPLRSTWLGEPLLDRAGNEDAVRIAARQGRVIVNGGNCASGDVNWVHYVHAAYRRRARGLVRGLRYRLAHRRFLRSERAALEQASVIIANSERTAADLRRLLGLERARIHVVYYGIDPDRFRAASGGERDALRQRLDLPTDRLLVLFVGAMGDARKGFDTLYHAWKSLCARASWDPCLCVVGRGAQFPYWTARARRDGLDHSIRFLGFRNDVPDLMRAADLLVAPTRYDSYGLGVHEAICCGLPGIVSAGAGVAERYPPDLSGMLLPDPEDARDLAERLGRWRAAPDAARQAVRAFADELRSRTWDDMASQLLCAIETPGPASTRTAAQFQTINDR